jgi:hypothetical protein
MPVLENSSGKPLTGFAVRLNTTGKSPVLVVLDFGWLAANKPVQPNERRPIPGITALIPLSGDILSYEIKATLSSDGTFYGPDTIFEDFSGRIAAVRNMALDVQSASDKFALLVQYQQPKIPSGASVDYRAIHHKADMATILLTMRDHQGDQAVERAITRLTSLPVVTKGVQP